MNIWSAAAIARKSVRQTDQTNLIICTGRKFLNCPHYVDPKSKMTVKDDPQGIQREEFVSCLEVLPSLKKLKDPRASI
jgi:hypothetical protein